MDHRPAALRFGNRAAGYIQSVVAGTVADATNGTDLPVKAFAVWRGRFYSIFAKWPFS